MFFVHRFKLYCGVEFGKDFRKMLVYLLMHLGWYVDVLLETASSWKALKACFLFLFFMNFKDPRLPRTNILACFSYAAQGCSSEPRFSWICDNFGWLLGGFLGVTSGVDCVAASSGFAEALESQLQTRMLTLIFVFERDFLRFWSDFGTILGGFRGPKWK